MALNNEKEAEEKINNKLKKHPVELNFTCVVIYYSN